MIRFGASPLVIRALLRDALRHRVRVGAALVAGIVGIAMTTAVLVVVMAVMDAITGTALEAPKADWVVQARTSSGMPRTAVETIEGTLPDGSTVSPLMTINTKTSPSESNSAGNEPILVAGITPELVTLLSEENRRSLSAFGSSGQRAKSVRRMIEEASEGTEALGDGVDRLVVALDEIKSSVRRLREDAEVIARRSDQLGASSREMHAAIAELRGSLEDSKADVTRVRGLLSQLESELTQGRQRTTELRDQIAEPLDKAIRAGYEAINNMSVGRTDPMYEEARREVGESYGLVTGKYPPGHPDAGQNIDGYPGLVAVLDELASGLTEGVAAVGKVRRKSADFVSQLEELDVALARIESGSSQLAGGVQSLHQGLSTAVVALDDIEAAIESVQGELEGSVQSGIQELGTAFDSVVPSRQSDGPGKPRLILSEDWASAHGLASGDELKIRGPLGDASWQIADVVDMTIMEQHAVALGGLSRVAESFGRNDRIDSVFVRSPGLDDEVVRHRLQEAVGGYGEVVRPSDTTESYENSFKSVRSLLAVFAAIGIITAAGIVYFAWRLTLEDARANLARFRLVGARPADLAVGAMAALLPALLVSLAIGIPAGILLGEYLSAFTKDLVGLTQLAASPGTPVTTPAIGAALAGFGLFVVAWVGTVVMLVRMRPIEAISGRSDDSVGRRRWPWLVGIVAAIGVVMVPFVADGRISAAFVPLILLLLSLAFIVPKNLGRMINGWDGISFMSVGRELAYRGRRNAALVTVFALAVSMALGLYGTANSLKAGTERSVEAWTQADIFVRSSPPGQNLEDVRFDAEAQEVVADVSGVSSTAGFGLTTIEMNDTRVPVWSWDASKVSTWVDLRVVEGPSGADLWSELQRHGAAVSSNFAQLNQVGVGDRIELPTSTGTTELRIKAIFKDLTSDAGVVVVPWTTHRSIAGSDSFLEIQAQLAPDASEGSVVEAIKNAMASKGYPGVEVMDQASIRNEFGTLTSRLLDSFILFARILFILAILIGAATLATTLAVRQRDIGVARLVGGEASTLRGMLYGESMILGSIGWAIGAPIGILLVPVLIDVVGSQSGLSPRAQLPWLALLVTVPLTIALSAASMAVAGIHRAFPSIATAVAEE